MPDFISNLSLLTSNMPVTLIFLIFTYSLYSFQGTLIDLSYGRIYYYRSSDFLRQSVILTISKPSVMGFEERKAWGYSSVGRAPALQAGGHEFESHYLHQGISGREAGNPGFAP